MRPLRAFLTQVTTANPEAVDCPAPTTRAESVEVRYISPDRAQIYRFEGQAVFRGRRIAGVVGPIACNGCEVKCNDAYITLEQEQIQQLEEGGIARADTHLVLPEVHVKTTSLFAAEPRNIDSQSTRNNIFVDKNRLFGEAARQNSIIDSIIDVHEADFVSIDDRGDVQMHHEIFQPELEFLISPILNDGTEEQLKLF